jgi:hypothetical protein
LVVKAVDPLVQMPPLHLDQPAHSGHRSTSGQKQDGPSPFGQAGSNAGLSKNRFQFFSLLRSHRNDLPSFAIRHGNILVQQSRFFASLNSRL